MKGPNPVALSVNEVLTLIGGRIENEAELPGRWEDLRVLRPAPLGTASEGDIAFFFSRAFEQELLTARPSVLVTAEPFVGPIRNSGLPLWKKTVVISHADPYGAMAAICEYFAPTLSTVSHSNTDSIEAAFIHPSATVASSAVLGLGVRIAANCVIEDDVRIGAGTVIYPGCVIGPGCTVGEQCVLFPRVTLYECTQLGNRVRLHAGSVLGADGFGYAPVREGKQVTRHRKIYHLGRVVVEDDVEIGANSCVDRGTLGETRIGKGSKLDNLVHIGHNAQLSEGAIVCGGTCLAGNASIGKFAYVGGLTGVGNHVHVGDGANVGALTMVTKDIPARGTAVGNPQREYKEHFKAHALLGRLLAERRSK